MYIILTIYYKKKIIIKTTETTITYIQKHDCFDFPKNDNMRNTIEHKYQNQRFFFYENSDFFFKFKNQF